MQTKSIVLNKWVLRSIRAVLFLPHKSQGLLSIAALLTLLVNASSLLLFVPSILWFGCVSQYFMYSPNIQHDIDNKYR